MQFTIAVDDFLFDRLYQPLVNRFPEAGPVGVGRFLIMGCMLAILARIYVGYQHGVAQSMVMQGFLLAILFTIYATVGFMSAQKLGVRNWQRVDGISRFVRFICLSGPVSDAIVFAAYLVEPATMDVPMLVWALGAADNVLFISYLYAIACDRMPPMVSRAVPDGERIKT